MRQCIYTLIIVLLCTGLARPAPAAEGQSVGRVTAHSAWTAAALYLGVRVDDPLIVGNQRGPLGQPWLDDAVAIYLDLNPTGDDILDGDCFRFVVSAAGGVTVQRGDKGEWRDDASWFELSDKGTIRVATTVDGKLNDSAQPDNGYAVELGLAWSLLGVQPPFVPSATSPLPVAGYAVACYSQGETRAVSCWPDGVMEEDLEHPARWGKMLFLQNARPAAVKEGVANAPLMMLDPFIDGDVRATEWVMAGSVSFDKRWGKGMAPLPAGRQTVALTAAWYTLYPDAPEPMHHPREPLPPDITPASMLYHQLQVKALRETGIDAIAVEIPAPVTAETRARLLAFVDALRAYDVAATSAHLRDVPLVLPVIDCGAVTDPAAQGATIDAALREAVRAIPAPYRLTMALPDGGRGWPVALVAPANPGALDALPLAKIAERLRADGQPVGWLPDAAWTGETAPSNTLTRCAWNPSAGVQVGAGGPLRTALIAPGVAARRGYLSRDGGVTYDNGWVKVAGAQPDFVLIRSWNDFPRGTEIAASRQYGNEYLDATRLAIMRMGAGRAFGLSILAHTLPPVLRAGGSYPVKVLIKNGSLDKLVAQNGFAVSYRVLQRDDVVLSGDVTDSLMLFDLSSSRINFTLPTVANRKPLAPGAYQLCLDFRRNKVPFLTAPLLTERLGTLAIPFTIANSAPRAQCVETAFPGHAAAGQRLPAGVQVRNLGDSPWRKGKLALRLRWVTEAGDPLSGEERLPLRANVGTGADVVFAGALPPAPDGQGWARVRAELLAGETPVEPGAIPDTWIALQPAQAAAQVLALKGPEEMGNRDVTVPVTLRNSGATTWEPATTRLTYQWLTWDGRPLPDIGGITELPEAVAPGDTVTLGMLVVPPPGAGSFRCAFSLLSNGRPASLFSNPAEPVAPTFPVRVRAGRWVPLDLSKQANGVAATAERVGALGGLDREGAVFPLEEYLPDATMPPVGYKPGYYFGPANPNWPEFLFPRPKEGRASMVRGVGQTMSLPAGCAAALHLVACNAAATGPATFIVTYDDDTTDTLTVTVANVLDEPANQEPVMLRARGMRGPSGDDWYLYGSAFVYRLPLADKPLKSLTLPAGGGVCVLAMTLEVADK